MPSTPPTVDDLEAEVADECGQVLADVGLFLRAADGTTPAIRRGLRVGMKAVSASIADPLRVQDSDLLYLSTFAIERVLLEATLYALEQVLANWWRATRKEQDALSSSPVASGYLLDEQRAVKARVSELKAISDRPFREPTDEFVIANPAPGPFGSCPPGDAVYPLCYPWGFW